MSWSETLFLKKIIDGSKRFVANDTTLVANFDGNRNTRFKPKLSGAIKFKIAVYTTSQASGDLVVKFYNSSEQYVEKRVFVSGATITTFDFLFDIVAGETYDLDVDLEPSGIIQSIELCASVEDYNYFKIE